MKSTLRFLTAVISLFIITIPLVGQWIRAGYGCPVNATPSAFTISDANVFVGTDSGVFVSTNDGTNWTAVNNGLTNTDIHALTNSDANIFAGTDSGVYISSNNGTNWTAVNAGLTNTPITALAVSGTNLFAGTSGGTIFLSTNNGANWFLVFTGKSNTNVWCFAVSDTNLFAGTDGGIFRSAPPYTGTSWAEVSTAGFGISSVNALAFSDSNLFANDGPFGVEHSTDDGASWSRADNGLTNTVVLSFAVSAGKLFAGTFGDVFLSTNNGSSWTEVNSGIAQNSIYVLSVFGTNLFAGVQQNGVWRRPLSEMVASVKRNPNDIPTHFNLEQNFPNPFNPGTTIRFSLPSQSFVSLKVFDALGREVSVIVSEKLPAGTYARQWNAAALSSGVYFYRLQAGSFVETKKLIFLK